MTIPTLDPMMTAAWKALDACADAFNPDLRTWFEADPDCALKWTKTAADPRVDLSKDLIDEGVLADLLALTQQCSVGELRDRMFAGECINTTKDRAVLHTALRRPDTDELIVDDQDAVANVHEVLTKVYDFTDHVRSGEQVGITGKVVKTIMNVSIGDSDLGPVMAYEALKPFVREGLECRFISNIDPTDADETTGDLDPETALVIIASKTFTTLETITNVKVVRDWFLSSLREKGLAQDETGEKEAVVRHFVAVSAALNKVAESGIDPNNTFDFWSWVGGRYSVDSAVGISPAITIGPDGFEEFLAGFNAIDEHFLNAAPEQSAPLLMGLLNIWYSNFPSADTHAVLPYSQYLHRFPVYLRQLTTESNGKSVRRDGTPVTYETDEVFWDEPGTSGQHALYQLIHQGTRMIPADFITFANPAWPLKDGEVDVHGLFLSDFFAQTKALAFGKVSEEVRAEGTPEAIIPARVLIGNRPTVSIMAASSTPRVLGELVVLYEYITFAQSAVWGIDSFDQQGVEPGKVLARQILPAITGDTDALAAQDSSIRGLIEFYRANRA